MSSIVKAKAALYDVPYKVEYCTTVHESSSYDMETAVRNEVKEKKEEILRQAMIKSKQIEAEANNRANSLVNSALKSSKSMMLDAELKGFNEGFQRGLEEGRMAAEQAAEAGLAEIKRLIEAMKAVQKETMQTQEQDLVNLAFEIAGKIIRQEVQSDDSAVLKMIEEIILENQGNIKITLSEYQKSLGIYLDKSIIQKIRSLSKDAKVVLVKEEDIILVETETGIIDMSVPVQTEQLKLAVDEASVEQAS
ncbi:FliH/SctL family protein [Sinanaerobacter chloroacetimidivorans]|uniref:FliH/SctL family protein n=1 Tax=Sinanaerobacter chloroacetimidivorans TaxID=2818044 RepID=UPI001D04414A|nr:FliH/SctL family protein [Sinanaerobacter chloroacetimidivorans]